MCTLIGILVLKKKKKIDILMQENPKNLEYFLHLFIFKDFLQDYSIL